MFPRRWNLLSILVVVTVFGVFATSMLGFIGSPANEQFPPLTGRVVDNANLLSASARENISQQLSALESRTTDQLVVVTIPNLHGNSIEDFGYRLGRHWGIGQREKDNGVLLIVAPNDRKIRIEVGYGLEGTLTDAVTSNIIQESILPRFRTNDMEGGIIQGVDAIIAVLTGSSSPPAALSPHSSPAINGIPSGQPQPVVNGGFEYLPIMMFVGFFFLMFLLVTSGRILVGVPAIVMAMAGSTALKKKLQADTFYPRYWWLLRNEIKSSGGSGGGGFGGGSSGGFSGGGGSFGGGGSTGRW